MTGVQTCALPICFSLPLSPPQNLPNYLTFFSIAHFWELFNGQLLCCGISFLFVFYLLFKIVKLKIILPPKVYFLITITGCILLLILVANFHRGSADWDIMAFSAVTLNLLTSILLYNVYNNQTNLLNYLQLSIFGLNAITAFLWVHINHTDKSIKKIEKMLLTDPGNYYTRLPSCIELGVLYKINHLEKEVETTLLNACNISQVNDLRPCIMYARNLIELGKVDEGAKFYEDLLLRNQCIPEAYMFLLEYYEKNGNYTNFLDYYHKFFDAFMLQPNYFILKYEPKIYLKLFEYLYKIELPNNNKHKLDEISFAIEKLKTMIPKK